MRYLGGAGDAQSTGGAAPKISPLAWYLGITNDKIIMRLALALSDNVQTQSRDVAPVRDIRDRSNRGSHCCDFDSIQEGPGATGILGDEAGLPGKPRRACDAALG